MTPTGSSTAAILGFAVAALAVATFIAWTVWYARHLIARDRVLDAAAIDLHHTGELDSVFQLPEAGPILLPYQVGCQTFLDHMLSITDEYAQARASIAQYKDELHAIEQRWLRIVDCSFDGIAHAAGYPGGMVELDGMRLEAARDAGVPQSTLSDSTKEIPRVTQAPARPRGCPPPYRLFGTRDHQGDGSEMSWQILAIRIVLAADFVVFVAWIGLYSRVHWRGTPVGRHLMAFAVVIASLLGLTFLRAWLGPVVYWLWLLGLIALGLVGLQRTILLVRLQRRGDKRERTADR